MTRSTAPRRAWPPRMAVAAAVPTAAAVAAAPGGPAVGPAFALPPRLPTLALAPAAGGSAGGGRGGCLARAAACRVAATTTAIAAPCQPLPGWRGVAPPCRLLAGGPGWAAGDIARSGDGGATGGATAAAAAAVDAASGRPHRRLPPPGGDVVMRAKRPSRKRSRLSGGGGSTGGDGAASSRRPPRVDSNLNVPIRQQLRAVKSAAAAAAAVRSRPVLRTRFRRYKTDEVVADAWAAKEQSQEEEEVRPRVPKGKYLVGPPPIAFIDGYNIIGWWPQLKKRRDEGDWEGARQRLQRYVEEFATIRDWVCVIVYDAHNTSHRRRTESISDAVSVVYTGGETADSYIEAATYAECRAGKRQVWGATSDLAQARVIGGQGGHVMSARHFVAEMMAARQEGRQNAIDADDIGAARQASMLINNVNPAVREALYKLRDRLK